MSAPYLPLYTGDYIRDTRHLNRSEHGAYMLLLMAMWDAGGRLPSDDKRLARIAMCSPDEWADMRSVILEFFKRRGGHIYSSRMQKELAWYNNKIEQAKLAGKASAKASAFKKANKIKEKSSTGVVSDVAADVEPTILSHPNLPSEVIITIIDAPAPVDPNDWAKMLAEATAAAGDQLDQTSTGVKHAADLRALVEPQSGEPCLWSEVIAAIGMVRTRSERTRKPIRSWSWIRDDAIKLRDIRLSADMPGVNQSNIIGGGYDGPNGSRAATPTIGETRRAGAALALDRLRSSQSGGDDDGGGYPRLAVIS
jgi:uncharacterized protein YdaU (DUF1376 family)